MQMLCQNVTIMRQFINKMTDIMHDSAESCLEQHACYTVMPFGHVSIQFSLFNTQNK